MDKTRIVLTLEPLASPVPVENRLRMVLKKLLREFEFKATSISLNVADATVGAGGIGISRA